MKNSEELLTQGNLPKQHRTGCKDLWNAFMVEGASFSSHDIPLCPTYIPEGLPKELISFAEAKTIYNKEIRNGNKDFCHNAFIHFYCDDQHFDGTQNSIWLFPEKALEIIRHFKGIITPDFSTYSDFPDPIKRYNTYRMRAFGYWCKSMNIPTINNVRWGTPETWEYCFDGIEKGSVICIGTVASGLRELENRSDFYDGFQEMIRILTPQTIIIYGSSRYEVFRKAQDTGIEIISFTSQTTAAYQSRKGGDNP